MTIRNLFAFSAGELRFWRFNRCPLNFAIKKLISYFTPDQLAINHAFNSKPQNFALIQTLPFLFLQNALIDESCTTQNGDPDSKNETSSSSSSLSISCPSLTDQLLLNARPLKEQRRGSHAIHEAGCQVPNGHHDAASSLSDQRTPASHRQPKTRNRINLVKQQQRKCYSTNRQSKTKMGDLCGKSMSQSASAMSIKQPPAGQLEKEEAAKDDFKEKIKGDPETVVVFPKVSKKAISSSTNLPSDANNNTTAGSVKILVNDITPSNSQEFLLQQQQRQSSSPNSSRCSQQTSPIHRRALMQQSRSTSNITGLQSSSQSSNPLPTKEQLFKSQPSTGSRERGETGGHLCHCPASSSNLNAKHKTRRRSWSSSSCNELPSSVKTPLFPPHSNVPAPDQTASRSLQQENLDQIKAQLEYW